MTAIHPIEIGPSLIAFLDVAVLRRCPGCLCSTPVVEGVVHGTSRNGPFLVLAVDKQEGACTCVPLYGGGGPGRIGLEQRLKTGPGKGWRDGLSFFSVHEFWRIPLPCFVDASHIEFSERGARQRYAQRSPGALAAILSHQGDSGSPFQPLRP